MKNIAWLERTELLVQEQGLKNLISKHVMVVGLGGIGSFAAEFIARAGVGKMTIVDGDDIDPTNANRQLPALTSTIGKSKAQLMADRLLDINPELDLTVIEEFLSPERTWEVVTSELDYVMDCIDSVTPKINLLTACRRKKIRVVSSMGAGGIMDPAQVIVRDISKTYNCVLAKQVRKRLKKIKIDKGIRTVFSSEIPAPNSLKMTNGANYKKSFYGTISYMPALFGCTAASVVIRELIKKNTDK